MTPYAEQDLERTVAEFSTQLVGGPLEYATTEEYVVLPGKHICGERARAIEIVDRTQYFGSKVIRF